MIDFTIVGVILGLIGAIFMIPEFFWGYSGILTNTVEQAKEKVWIEEQRFLSQSKNKVKKKEDKYIKEIRIWKIMKFIGFILLIIGFSLQLGLGNYLNEVFFS